MPPKKIGALKKRTLERGQVRAMMYRIMGTMAPANQKYWRLP